MAVRVNKSGGIYIEINGDYSQFQEDMKNVRKVADSAANGISTALSGAISPRQSINTVTSLSRAFQQAKRSAEALNADLSKSDAQLEAIGRAIGVSEKSLAQFVATQKQAFQNQTTRNFQQNLRTIQRLTGQSNEEMNRLAKSIGGVGNEFQGATRQADNFASSISKAVLVFAAYKVGGAVKDIAVDSFFNAARYETLQVALYAVGQNAGYANIELDKHVNELRKTGIAGIEARNTLTSLVQAQIDLTQSSKLARVAQDAAVIGNTNSSQAFERLVYGIQSAQTQVLRTIGINVNFERSYRNLAKELGTTASELTETQRVQARVNAVLEAGEAITGTYAAAMETAGKQASSLSRILSDFSTDVGAFANDIAKGTGIIKGLSTLIEANNATLLYFRGRLKGIREEHLLKAFWEEGNIGARELIEGTESAKEEFEKLERQLQRMAANGINVDAFLFELESLRQESAQGTIAIDSLRRALDSLGVTINAQLTQGTQAFNSGLEEQIDKFISLEEKVRNDLLKGTQQARLEQLDKQFDGQIQSLRESIRLLPATTEEYARAQNLLNRTIEEKERQRLAILGKAGRNTRDALKRYWDDIESLRGQFQSPAQQLARVLDEIAEAGREAGLSVSTLQIEYAAAFNDRAARDFEAAVHNVRLEVARLSGDDGLVRQMENIRRLQDMLNTLYANAQSPLDFAMAGAAFGSFAGALQVEQLQKNEEIVRRFYSEVSKLRALSIDERQYLLTKELDLYRQYIDDAEALALLEARKLLEIARTSRQDIEAEWAKLRLGAGEGNFDDVVYTALHSITDNYTNLAYNLADTWGDFFQGLSSGFANSIGQAIVYSDNLNEALLNVARQGVAGLISGLVELGIQWAINQALGQSLASASAAATTAIGTAQATALSAAYAPAAALVSLATLGGNAAPASTAIASTLALTKALSVVTGFEQGGYTGNGGISQIAGVVHGQEYVIPAAAVSNIGVGALDSLVRSSSRSGTNMSTGGGSGSFLSVTIENYGTSKSFEVEQLSETEVRVIARDEAQSVVRKETPSLVAADLGNSNSSISKSLQHNYQVPRRY